MVYKLSWADFDGTKKLLIGSGGDLVRTNVDGDPTECCCPEDLCIDAAYSGAFTDPEWEFITNAGESNGAFDITGVGNLRFTSSGNPASGARVICRAVPALENGDFFTTKVTWTSSDTPNIEAYLGFAGSSPFTAVGHPWIFTDFNSGGYFTTTPGTGGEGFFINQAPVSGDEMEIQCEVVDNTTNTWKCRFYINSVLKRTSSNFSPTGASPPDPAVGGQILPGMTAATFDTAPLVVEFSGFSYSKSW